MECGLNLLLQEILVTFILCLVGSQKIISASSKKLTPPTQPPPPTPNS